MDGVNYFSRIIVIDTHNLKRIQNMGLGGNDETTKKTAKIMNDSLEETLKGVKKDGI